MRNYELVCILDPQVGDNKFDDVVEKYENFLKAQGAEIAHTDRWGMRQLQYTSPSLKKRRQGYYVLYQFVAEPATIPPLESELGIDEGVLRHLIVLIEGEFLRVPELAPESVLTFGPPHRDRRDGRPPRDRDRDRDRDREPRRRDDSAPDRSAPAAEAPVVEAAAAEAAAEDTGDGAQG